MTVNMSIRMEEEEDLAGIERVISLAFENDPMSDKREAEIVSLMRQDNALTLSLVAEIHHQLVGHVAFSKVSINDEFTGWYGLAPVSVDPQFQQQGIGAALINEGMQRLRAIKAKGCVLLGDPGYYWRFGFKAYDDLVLPDVPAEYFLAVPFDNHIPVGTVKYHQAFS